MFVNLLSTLAVLGLAVAAPHKLAKRDFTGRTTFYTPDDSEKMTACGIMYTDANVKIAALSMSQFSMDLCNQEVTVTYQGKSVTALIWDGCETCSFGQIDLSPGAMSVLDSNYVVTGQFTASWSIGGGGGDSNNEETTTSEKKPSPTPEPSTSTWTPEPTTSSTPAPEPSTTSSPSPSPTPSTTTLASSSAALSSLSSLSASSLSSLASSTGLSATSSLNATSTSMNVTTTATVATVAIHTGTATIAPDAVVSTAVEDTGNFVVLNDVVARLGRIIIAAAAA